MNTIAFQTLGCKLNFSETATLSRLFIEQGYQKVGFNQASDVYVINTCSVTEEADKKCRQVIRKAIRQNPEATVIVTGCFAQLKPKEIINIPGVSLVLGANEKLDFNRYLAHIQGQKTPETHTCEINEVDRYFAAHSLSERTRSFLKVQDGCDYPCTYCTIPKARGKSRNATVESIRVQAESIAAKGIRELILTGVNIGDFGKSTGESFFDLIKALEQVKGIDRIRISSIEPNLLTDEMLDHIAKSKVIMPHFHIPLQSGSDTVLRLMKRRYNTKIFIEKIERINRLMPHAAIGIDVIVGFPGETDELFEETELLLNSLEFMNLHVFSYSERPGTPASTYEHKVGETEKQHRSQILHRISDKKQRAFNEKFLNSERVVLVENKHRNGNWYGFTDNYIKVELQGENIKTNQFINVQMIKQNTDLSVVGRENQTLV